MEDPGKPVVFLRPCTIEHKSDAPLLAALVLEEWEWLLRHESSVCGRLWSRQGQVILLSLGETLRGFRPRDMQVQDKLHSPIPAGFGGRELVGKHMRRIAAQRKYSQVPSVASSIAGESTCLSRSFNQHAELCFCC